MEIFSQLVEQLKNIIPVEFGIIKNNIVTACTDKEKNGTELNNKQGRYIIRNAVKSRTDDYFVFIDKNIKQSEMLAELIAFNANEKFAALINRNSKKSFIQKVIQNKIDKSDIRIIANELGIKTDVSAVIYIIRVKSKQNNDIEKVLNSLFPERSGNYSFLISENEFCLIKNVRNKLKVTEEEKQESARIIVDTISTECLKSTWVGIGTYADSIYKLHESYNNAYTALFVRNIFDSQKHIVSYTRLGIDRLVYKMPKELCRLYLDEVFPNGMSDFIEENHLKTVNAFFQNNLNISETSKVLYVHRNTLKYRLDKIMKDTGLDLRTFNDAITFDLAVKVKKYLDYLNRNQKKQ